MIMIFPKSIHTLTMEDMVAYVRISSLFIQMTIFFSITHSFMDLSDSINVMMRFGIMSMPPSRPNREGVQSKY